MVERHVAKHQKPVNYEIRYFALVPLNGASHNRGALYTTRKGTCESKHRIDLNCRFMNFSSERGMKLGRVKFILVSDVHESRF